MAHKFSVLLLSPLMILAASACEAPMSPAAVVGDYGAIRVGDRGVPFAVELEGDRYEFLYDSVTLRPDGTAQVTTRVEFSSWPDEWKALPSTHELARWTLDGNELTLRRVCPEDGLCLSYTWVRRYRVQSGGLFLRSSGSTPTVYERTTSAAP
jgi:hypothetical protein